MRPGLRRALSGASLAVGTEGGESVPRSASRSVLGAALAVAEAHVPSYGTSAARGAWRARRARPRGRGRRARHRGRAGRRPRGRRWWRGLRLDRRAQGAAASRRRVRGGAEGLIGRVGEVRAAPAPSGRSSWTARCGARVRGPATRTPSLRAATRSSSNASTGSRSLCGGPRNGRWRHDRGAGRPGRAGGPARSRWPRRRSACCASTSARWCSGSAGWSASAAPGLCC